MDEQFAIQVPQNGPEQINNIRQQRLVRNRHRAVEAQQRRLEHLNAAVAQGQVGGGGRPGVQGGLGQELADAIARAGNNHVVPVQGGLGQELADAIARAGNNHVVPWRQGQDQQPAAGGGGNDHNDWRRMNVAMRRWRDLVDPINPENMRDMAPRDMAEIMRGLPGPGGGGGGLPNPIEDWARRFGLAAVEQRAIVERNLRAGGGARLRRPAQAPPARAPLFGRPAAVPETPRTKDPKPHVLQNMTLDGDMLLAHLGCIGQFTSGRPVTPESSYFEVEIVSVGSGEAIVNIGFTAALGAGGGAKPKGSSVRHLGVEGTASLGFNATQGSLSVALEGSTVMRDGLTKCREGDRVGVGLKFYQTSNPNEHSWRVYLTVNDTKIPKGGVVVTHKTELYPSVTVQQPAKGDELCALAIKVLPGDPLGSTLGGGDMMAVDTADEEWLRLHDVRLNGPILEYVGRGKSGLVTNSIFFCFLFVKNH